VSKKVKFITILIFIALYLLTRLPRIGTTIVNTDEVYWNDRSERFLNAVKSGDFKETFQKYHPGVPLMWEMSIASEILSATSDKTTEQVFNDFELIHTGTQVLLCVLFLLLSILLIFLLYKALENWWLAFFSVVVLTLEPFYIGNSRLIHHDVQISLCVLIAITLVYLFSIKKSKVSYIIFSSFFLAIATLSKTLFVGAFAFCLFGGFFLTFFNKGVKKAWKFSLVLTTGFLFFYFALFPAMWVNARETVYTIVSQSQEVGEEDGHIQIFYGQRTRDPGPTFYPVLIWLKTSPFMFVGMGVCLIAVVADVLRKLKSREKLSLKNVPFIVFSGVFYIGYFAVITYFTKKVDRYIIVLYPYFALISTYGWYRLVRNRIIGWISLVALFSVTVAYPLYTLSPHYLMYVNPIVGDAKDANEIIGQKLFGIGVFDLRDKIEKIYGNDISIGINDFWPLKSIYPNGKVYNVLVEHPNSFKIMILGPNKVFPEAMKKEPEIKFKQVDSVFINGLEFWRIYQKAY